MTDPGPSSVIGVVDDDLRILESLRNLLESADYGVRLFSSAQALLDSAHLSEIDCLISDINMPVTDGFQLSRIVRVARPGLPIVLITGHPDMLSRLTGLGIGNLRVLKKPFNGEELLETVTDALQSAKSS